MDYIMGKNLIKRIIIFILGMAIIQIGVSLSLVIDIGSECFTVFNQGLARSLNVSQGLANIIISFIFICIILIFNRSYIKIGTFVCLIGVGPLIDLLIWLLNMLPISETNIVTKSLFVLLASFIIAIGFSILSSANLGVGPNDIIPFLLRDKTKYQYKWIRMILDFSYLILGFILGGTVGIGTVIFALSLGPFIQLCLPYGEKAINKIIVHECIDK